MINKINIKFRLTTRKYLKCNYCRELIDGKEGFVENNFINGGRYDEVTRLFFCLKCWDNLTEEIKADRSNKEEDYKILLKKQILRKLNK
jgi:DNA-directed RNA polymerase subunit RPC12/RpoP